MKYWRSSALTWAADMTTQKITLTADCATPDGRPFRRGAVRFLPSQRIADSTDSVLIEAAPARCVFPALQLVPGAWGESTRTWTFPTVDLFPCDLVGPQDGSTPGWYYTVYYDGCPGNPAPWSFYLLSTGGTAQRLSGQTAVTPS